MKLNLKDIQKYLFPIKRIFSKYRQIKSLEQVKSFIQEQSAQVSQMTLYGYLKTRMGAKHVLMFEDKDFLKSINIAKWHIYAASLIDCTFFCFSFLYKERNFSNTEEANKIFFEILNTEKANVILDTRRSTGPIIVTQDLLNTVAMHFMFGHLLLKS